MKRHDFQFEVCANSVESCLAAQAGGADRVELCAGIPEGGTTPSYGEIVTARRLLHATRLHVIIRPRGGNFVYSDLEAERMLADIEQCRRLGVDGVVLGCLTPQGDVDEERLRPLVAAARGMSLTFHRAFDRCAHPAEALETIIGLGFNRLLTSGTAPTAPQGAALLRQLHVQARGRIALMAGSGVNEDNIAALYAATGIRQYHFSARRPEPAKSDALFGSVLVTTSARVEATISSLITQTL